MNEDKINLIKILGFLEKAKEIIQMEGLVGGHRGDVDDSITIAINIIWSEIYE